VAPVSLKTRGSDGIGGTLTDASGTCVSACNVYLASSGAVTSATTLNLSAPYIGITGTSTLTVGASGYYWNAVNSLGNFTSFGDYYIDPQATTVALLNLGSASNAWHVGGAFFPKGTTDYNGQVFVLGALEVNGTSTLVGAATGRNFGSFQGGLQAIKTETAAYSMVATDYTILCNATSAAVTITLNAAPNTGQIVIIKKIDSSANACTIAGNGKTMDGASSLSLGTQYQVERLQYNGTSWSAI
jgi:hypothetical protein